jgi:hypothetical protein
VIIRIGCKEAWKERPAAAAAASLVMMITMWSRLLVHMDREAQKRLEHSLREKNTAAGADEVEEQKRTPLF